MSIISSGTTTTTALVQTGNTDGTLQLQVNGTTPSVTLNTLGAVGVGVRGEQSHTIFDEPVEHPPAQAKGGHRRDPAGGGGVRAGGDGLLVRLAGFAEVNVDVDEAGAGDETAGIDLAGALLRRRRQGGDKLAVDDEDVADRIALRGRVDDPGVFDPEGRHVRGIADGRMPIAEFGKATPRRRPEG